MVSEVRKRELFDALVRRYGTDLFRYAVWLCGDPALASDLVQETCLRAWKGIGRLNDEGAAKSWLLTILRREYARTFERKRLPLSDIDAVPEPVSAADGPEQVAETRNLRECVLRLPPTYREPLLMQVVLGLSCDEIATELDIGRNAVMTRLFRAREKLKASLHKDGITGNVHELF